MLNFTVGPVQASENICAVGARQVPYFRTAEFSKIIKENEKFMLELSNAPVDSRTVFMTNSSTGAMEAVVMNCFTGKDHVLVINGGSFGYRFVQLCKIHDIPYTELTLKRGQKLTRDELYKYYNYPLTGLLVNINETSTGVLYDAQMIGDFCKEKNLFYVCDCVSSFLADSFDMNDFGVDVMITGSQKVLACPPGVSVIVLSPRAIDVIEKMNVKSMYFNLADALKNGERGQTPFTPAVGILIQINERLKEIIKNGGAQVEIQRIAAQADDFRRKVKELPFEIASESLANAVTPLYCKEGNAYDIFLDLKDKYGIWICPNGGEWRENFFRVGHIGCLTFDDNTTLINALKDIVKMS